MFARVAQLYIQPDRREEFLALVHNEFQPLMQNQPGFVDAVSLHSETDPNAVLAISFWRTHDDVERFLATRQYTAWRQKALTYLRGEPSITSYSVETSTFHHIARGKAA